MKYYKYEPLITHEITEQVTAACAETERSLTLGKEVYDKWRTEVDHWLRGGEVEGSVLTDGSGYVDITHHFKESTTDMDWSAFRIKPRQSVTGEVWEFSDGAYLITQSCHGVSATRLDGNQFKPADYSFEDGVRGTRVASSIQEYIARKLRVQSCKTNTPIIKVVAETCSYND